MLIFIGIVVIIVVLFLVFAADAKPNLESKEDQIQTELRRRVRDSLAIEANRVLCLLGYCTGEGFEYYDKRIRVKGWGPDYRYEFRGVAIFFEGNLVLSTESSKDSHLPGEWEAYFRTLVSKANVEENRRNNEAAEAAAARRKQEELDHRRRHGL